jgi:hypothetical protein
MTMGLFNLIKGALDPEARALTKFTLEVQRQLRERFNWPIQFTTHDLVQKRVMSIGLDLVMKNDFANASSAVQMQVCRKATELLNEQYKELLDQVRAERR